MKVENYCVVSAKSRWALELEVKKYLANGWVPQGGIAVNSNYDDYIQAMVKYAME